MKIQNVASYAIDTPIGLAPGESADVEASEETKRQIEAGIIVEITEPVTTAAKDEVQPSVQETKAEDK